jgi:hypothetical protein
MKKSELHKLIDQVRVRHNRRALFLYLLLLCIFLIGIRTAPAAVPSDPSTIIHRQYYIEAVMALFFTTGVVGIIIVFNRVQVDVAKFQAICPQCNQSLYPARLLLLGGRNAKETEVCPHCRHRLIDEA